MGWSIKGSSALLCFIALFIFCLNSTSLRAMDADSTDIGAVDRNMSVPIAETRDYLRKTAPQSEESPLDKKLRLYSEGKLSKQEAAQIENAVHSGSLVLAPGMSLNSKPAAYVLPPKVVAAFNSHRMSDEDRAYLLEEYKAGNITVPKGMQLVAPKPSAFDSFMQGISNDLPFILSFIAFGSVLFLLTKQWFWNALGLVVFIAIFLCNIASFFAMLASIIHFQILGAIGYFVLSVILTVVMNAWASRV